MTDFRTPLSRVRGLGAAREGTGHFWYQRVTAVANLPLVLFFIGLVIALSDASYADVRATLGNPFVTLALVPLMHASQTFHAAVLIACFMLSVYKGRRSGDVTAGTGPEVTWR